MKPTTHHTNYISVRVVTALVGTGLLINGYLFNAIYPAQRQIGYLSILLSIFILSCPIFFKSIISLLDQGSALYSDILISTAIIAALVIEDYLTAALVPIVMTLSHIIEEKSIVGAHEAIEGLTRLSAKQAVKIVNGKETLVDVNDLRPGDTILTKPGDLIPCDGRVTRGNSTIDQSTITGESQPVDLSPGDPVFAGTSNLTGTLRVEVTEIGDTTTIGKIKNLLLEVSRSKSPIVKVFEQYARFYLPIILMISAIVWVYTKEPTRAITVLIIACPCAFIMAPSSAIIASLAVLSRLGILIKDTRFLELAANIDTVVFDKTGTITHGHLAVVAVDINPKVDKERTLSLAFALANNSNHPTSVAICNYCERHGIPLAEIEDVKEIQGKGMISKGRRMGRRKWLMENGIRDIPDLPPTIEVVLGENSDYLAHFSFMDTTKPNVAAVLDELKDLGVKRTVLLSGDKREITEKIATELGIDSFYAEQLPHEKLDQITLEKSDDTLVCMVGDGTNDSLALAAGDISVAMGMEGSDIAMNAADITLMNNNLNRLPMLMRISRKTLKVIHINFLIAVFWSLSILCLAILGYFTPVMAAVSHNFGAFLVILHSGKLLKLYQQHGNSP